MSKKQRTMLARILVAAALLVALHFVPATGALRFLLYLVPYLVIGYDILIKAAKGIRNRQVFDENFLMAIATVGAIALALYEGSGDYTEAVAVMLFYQVGEWFQSYAVGKSRRNISELMDIRPDSANVERDGALVQQLTEAFGGPRNLSDAGRSFIENWEAESYRKKVAGGANIRLSGKVAVVTGGAQGFGYGIAEELAAEGATVVIADMNVEGAKAAAEKLKAAGGASAVAVNIADEASVAEMVRSVVLSYGGIDLFVANAGVLKAGSVRTFEKRDWDFVTNVNYTGYFLCVKHVSDVMARQNACCNGWTDIVQVNSKSGLVGSNRNGAYAGSKFGTVGLTQSFALELVSDRIKVNSVCPGNFFDGPLWSDPERGLFVQYLKSGKVPGARTVADVKLHYEKQIPMHRGCFPSDVAKAIIYAVCQSYETGQAIPVTGGQVMLN